MLTSKLEKEINAIWKIRDSLSSKSNKKIINIIRNKLNFKNVLITDDISMKALKYDLLK